ncbi:MAG TPA: DUF192 domain-containing protein [Rikenellaceae bacterium]|nr:DUF192 domain-containing protein [Rikenellaceae bacterium]
MKLINVTKEKIVLDEVEVADSFVSRLKGLLGRKSLSIRSGLIIKPCNSVHCFFMKFPIDVAFVDKENRVVKIIFSMKPGSVSPIVSKSYFVIEANAGELEGDINLGDIVEMN